MPCNGGDAQRLVDTYTARDLAGMLVLHKGQVEYFRRRALAAEKALGEIATGQWTAEGAREIARSARTPALPGERNDG